MKRGDKPTDLEDSVSRYLKVELKRAGITYEELAIRLKNYGFSETKASIASKLVRGSFSATFFLATLRAIGRDVVTLADV